MPRVAAGTRICRNAVQALCIPIIRLVVLQIGDLNRTATILPICFTADIVAFGQKQVTACKPSRVGVQ